jgi:hypothetical protein
VSGQTRRVLQGDALGGRQQYSTCRYPSIGVSLTTALIHSVLALALTYALQLRRLKPRRWFQILTWWETSANNDGRIQGSYPQCERGWGCSVQWRAAQAEHPLHWWTSLSPVGHSLSALVAPPSCRSARKVRYESCTIRDSWESSSRRRFATPAQSL